MIEDKNSTFVVIDQRSPMKESLNENKNLNYLDSLVVLGLIDGDFDFDGGEIVGVDCYHWEDWNFDFASLIVVVGVGVVAVDIEFVVVVDEKDFEYFAYFD